MIKNKEPLLLSNFVAPPGLYKLTMRAYYTDQYSFEEGVAVIKDGELQYGPCSIDLQEDEVVTIITAGSFNILLRDHKRHEPFKPRPFIDAKELMDPAKREWESFPDAEIVYKKRNDGIYFNVNNPERTSVCHFAKGMIRHDISDQNVFMAFQLINKIEKQIYYGYQTINRSETEPAFITVRNSGYQLRGKGSWAGEQQWVDFYNLPFRVYGLESYSRREVRSWQAWYNFANSYVPKMNAPVTYYLPPQKAIYAFGGDSAHSFMNVDVHNTANQPFFDGCANGVVYLTAQGDVEAVLYAYNDPESITLDNDTHLGYLYKGGVFPNPRAYVGYDDQCGGMIDADLTFEFNDNTPSGDMPVQFTNYYDDSYTPGALVKPLTPFNSTPHHQKNKESWWTHCHPQEYRDAVGMDITDFKTHVHGFPVNFDNNISDAMGLPVNQGNWMIAYMENYTFCNHGKNMRRVTIKPRHSGALAVMIRDDKGNLITKPEYAICCHKDTYGAKIERPFTYTVEVPPGQFVQYTFEYVLPANSFGCVEHRVHLEQVDFSLH